MADRVCPQSWLSNLQGMAYDRSSRHALASELVSSLAQPGEMVLDLGGSDGCTKELLTGYKVVVVDLRAASADVRASALRLPFSDKSFAVAVTLDVLEHISEADREAALLEIARVARNVIIAGPYFDPNVARVESVVRQQLRILYGRDDPWLKEHCEHGLPTLVQTQQLLKSAGFEVAYFTSNPLDIWQNELLLSNLCVNFGIDPKALPIRNELLHGFLARGDATSPSYRTFVIGSTTLDPEAIVAPFASVQDVDLTQAYVDELRLTQIRIMREGIDSIINTLSVGWKESAERVSQLEQALAETRLQLSGEFERVVAASARSENDLEMIRLLGLEIDA